MYVEGIGEVLQWGEFWRLVYQDCGHEQWFSRTGHRLFAPDQVEAEVRRYYRTCMTCAWRAAQRKVDR